MRSVYCTYASRRIQTRHCRLVFTFRFRFAGSKCSYCNFASGVFAREMVARLRGPGLLRYRPRAADSFAQMGGILDRDSGFHLPRRRHAHDLGARPAASGYSPRCGRSSRSIATAEITVECAPGTLAHEMLETLVRVGVNRVSLGVQSFVDEEAAAVGRLHTRAVGAATTSRGCAPPGSATSTSI